MIHPAALATVLATGWFLRRTTLRLWEWVAVFLLAAPWPSGWLGCSAGCERASLLTPARRAVQQILSPTEGVRMCFALLAAAVLGAAAGVGLEVGRRRRPLLGVLATAVVLLAAVAGSCVVMGLSLAM